MGDEFRVMGEIRVHNNHKVAGDEFQAMYARCSETKISSALFEEDVKCVGFCELVGYYLGFIRETIVYADKLPIEISST